MSDLAYETNEFKMIPLRLIDTEKRFTNKTAYKFYENNQLKSISYSELLSETKKVAKYLYSFGLRKGDHIGIYSENRIEWVILSLAIQFLGGVTVGIYATASEIDFLHMASDSDVKFLAYGEKTKKFIDKNKDKLQNIIIKNISFINETSDIKNVGDDIFDFDTRTVNDLAQMVYTSGSSGSPKGALITHRAINYGIRNIYNIGNLSGDDRRGKETFFNFMPMAHIASSMVDIYLNIFYGFEVTINSDILNLQKELKLCRPTLFMAPPALWERFHKKIMEGLSKQTGVRRLIVDNIIKYKSCIFNINKKFEEFPVDFESHSYLKKANSIISNFTHINNKGFSRLFKIILAEIGLDNVKMCFTTGAKISDETIKFFSILGIDLVNIYGMSETTATAFYNSNRDHLNKVYYCGKEIENGQIKITDEGELCLKGPFLFNGYYKKEEEIKKYYTEDGYFKTGDLVKKYRNGYYKIEGRLKDTIVLKSGENVSPYATEDQAKTVPYLSFCLANGNERKDIELLIFVSNEDLVGLNDFLKLGYNNPIVKREEILSLDAVEKYYLKHVLNNNKNLSPLEKVGSVKIFKTIPSIENEILTPSLKVKRIHVIKNYNKGIIS